jgi:hypothetical protein
MTFATTRYTNKASFRVKIHKNWTFQKKGYHWSLGWSTNETNIEGTTHVFRSPRHPHRSARQEISDLRTERNTITPSAMRLSIRWRCRSGDATGLLPLKRSWAIVRCIGGWGGGGGCLHHRAEWFENGEENEGTSSYQMRGPWWREPGGFVTYRERSTGSLQDILHPVLYPFKDILCQYQSIRGLFFRIDHERILDFSIWWEKRISWFDPVAFKVPDRCWEYFVLQ